MKIGGVYVGLGEGDSSDEIAKIKAHLKRKYTPARNTLDDGPVFTPELTAEVKREQAIFKAEGKLQDYIPGVINLAFKYACGYLKKEVLLPLHFSIEGHLSNMWIGPAAHIGEVLRAEGRALHFPTGYDNAKLPFNNRSGVDMLARRIGSLVIHDPGMPAPVKFPAGTPFTVSAFSQGAMIWVEFYRQYLAPGKPLHWRLPDLRCVTSIGSPYRQKGLVADWITDPPADDRQGIMPADQLMTDTPWWWLELARRKDLYTDNESSGESGLYKTAVAKIVTQNSWSGGPAGMLARIIDLLSPVDDLIPITMSLISAIGFGVNMRPHMEHDLGPAIQFTRERLAA